MLSDLPQSRLAPLLILGGMASEDQALLPTTRSLPRAGYVGLIKFLAAVTEDAASDDQQIDLLRTLEDVVDLGIAHPFLDQVACANSPAVPAIRPPSA